MRPLSPNAVLFGAGLFTAAAFVLVQMWDDDAAAELRRQARIAKQHVLMYAVEESGHREAAFQSNWHCRVPVQGERLEMQHATAHDAGQGYRCVYRIMMQPTTRPATATRTWSRSPEIEETIVFGSWQ